MKKYPKEEEMIEELIGDDIDTVYSREARSYLYNILNTGFKGYKNYSLEELKQEYDERIRQSEVNDEIISNL